MGLRINTNRVPLVRTSAPFLGVDPSRLLLFDQTAPAGDHNGANPEYVAAMAAKKAGQARLNSQKAQEGAIVAGVGYATGVRRVLPLLVLFASPWLVDRQARLALVDSVKRAARGIRGRT